jgi:hypothetical protein
MPHGIIGIGLLIVMSFVVFNGLLMLAAPNKHRRFLTWFQGMGSGPEPSVHGPSHPGLDLGRRLAGLGLASMGIYIASNVIRDARLNEPGASATPVHAEGHIFSLIVGCFSLGSGSFVLLKPDWIVQWSKKHQPANAEVPDHMMNIWRRGAIFLGVMLLLGGLYTLWNVLSAS